MMYQSTSTRRPPTRAESQVLRAIKELGGEASANRIATRIARTIEQTLEHLRRLEKADHVAMRLSDDRLVTIWRRVSAAERGGR